jgi:ribosomal-protein-serine acetyltransferase
MKADRLPAEIPVDDLVCLKKLQLRSSDTIFRAVDQNREHLRKWLPFVDLTLRKEDTENFIKSILHNHCPKKDIVYEIWMKKDFAGLIALKEIDAWNKRSEIGYWLLPRFERLGLITRSCKALLDLSFGTLDLNRIQIKAAIGNARSCLVPERLGFKMEGVERNGELHQDRYFDLLVYSMLKKDWSGSKDQ